MAHRLARLARLVGLELPALRFFLRGSWLFWRLAYEISSERIGPVFETSTRGIDEELLRRHVPPGGTILDFGCGGGRLTRMAASVAGRVVGVDQSAENIARAKSYGVPPNVEYHCGDAGALLKQQRYDAVLLVHVLEHIGDPDALLSALRDQAAVIVVEVPNFEADALNSVRLALGSPYYSDADHVREFTSKTLREQLERNGLRVLTQETRGASLIAVAAGRA